MNTVCQNPLCEKSFTPKVYNGPAQIYCSPRCKTVAIAIKTGKMKLEDNFEEDRKGFIRLKCGIEIRNDAMGKEINTPLSVYAR